MYKPRYSRLSYADCGHICKFYIYNAISHDFGRFDVPLILIFAAARAPAHNNGRDPFERETFDMPRIRLFKFKEIPTLNCPVNVNVSFSWFIWWQCQWLTIYSVVGMQDSEQQIGKNFEDKNRSRIIYKCVNKGCISKQRCFDAVERGKVEGGLRDAYSLVQVCRHWSTGESVSSHAPTNSDLWQRSRTGDTEHGFRILKNITKMLCWV
jgi:hypothetical protein